MAHLDKFSPNLKFVFRNPSQSSTTLSILVPVWFIITSLMFFYLSELLFWGFFRFEGDFEYHKKWLKGATSRMAHLEKTGQFFQVRRLQSSTILVPLWFIITSLVFFYLGKLLFWGFLQFEGDFALFKNDSNYRSYNPGQYSWDTSAKTLQDERSWSDLPDDVKFLLCWSYVPSLICNCFCDFSLCAWRRPTITEFWLKEREASSVLRRVARLSW